MIDRSTRNNVYDLIHTAVWGIILIVGAMVVAAIVKGAWMVLTS